MTIEELRAIKSLGVQRFKRGDFEVEFFPEVQNAPDPPQTDDPIMRDVYADLSAAAKRRQQLREKGDV